MSLKTRFITFAVLLVGLIVVGSGITTDFFMKLLLNKEIRRGQSNLLNSFRNICEEAIATKNDFLLYTYALSLNKTVPGLAYAVFVDPKRKLTLGQNETFNKLFPNITAAQKDVKKDDPVVNYYVDHRGEQIVEIASKVISGGQMVGVARIGMMRKVVNENLAGAMNDIKRIIGGVAIGAFVVGVFGAWVQAKQLIVPISSLVECAKAIGQGNLDTRIDFNRGDEIGTLAKEFNEMAIKLKELDQLKDDFVSSVSHELRSPLSAISGYVELLSSKPLEQIMPEKRSKAFGIIRESTLRLAKFINDILDMAKIKAGRIDLHKQAFDVRAAIEELFGLFMPLFEKKRIEAKVDVPITLAPVLADGEKIKQVLTNLISNAIKFTPENGKIAIVAKEVERLVAISVSDTGIGIPKEYHHEIFERFKQVRGPREKAISAKGTGLGLAIAKGIVEAHSGKIWVESEPDKGSVFHFTLPRTAATYTHATTRLFGS